MREPLGHSRRASESGVALILAVMFGIIVSGIVVSGTLILRSHRAKTETNFRSHSQAAQFARAGLTEALGWFRKQTSQPVLNFAPQLDAGAVPPVLDTQDPDIGLVREFQISGSIWGRYEVWRRWDTDPIPERLAWRQKVQVTDVSAERGAAGHGNVWLLRSCSYVYRRVDPMVRFDAAPNHVLGTAILETELRRMTLVPPGMATICSANGGGTRVLQRVNIQGAGGAAIYYRASSGTPIVSGGAITEGGVSPATVYDGSIEAVFGVNREELRGLADDRVTDQTEFPDPVPSNTLYYVDVPVLELTPTRPLTGSGIVYVFGDVDFQLGSRSFFTGLLYVDGDLTMRETVEFNGALICTGTVRIEGISDWINLTYDDGALNSLRTEIGQYRLSGAIRSLVGED